MPGDAAAADVARGAQDAFVAAVGVEPGREDARLLEEAGCFALVLEKIPAKLAAEVAKSVSIPIIGIGAGSGCDGQVLVLHDMLGINKEFNPRFLRRYADLHGTITDAVASYVRDVRSRDFPNANEQY